MANTLEGTKIVIIGGTSGIGFAAAKSALLDHAAEVVVVSSQRINVDGAVDRLQKVVGETAGLVGVVKGEVVDASKPEEVRALFSRVGEIDHLVWTSGQGVSSSRTGFKDTDLDKKRDLLDLRFWGAATAAQVAKFRNGAAASLTLTTGASQVKPPAGRALSAGVLGAVDTLGRGLAVELAPVRVNVICPGLIKTKIWDDAGLPKVAQEALFDEYTKKLLVKHVADADEIADAYLFLMKCTYITGQTIHIDGGFTLV